MLGYHEVALNVTGRKLTKPNEPVGADDVQIKKHKKSFLLCTKSKLYYNVQQKAVDANNSRKCTKR